MIRRRAVLLVFAAIVASVVLLSIRLHLRGRGSLASIQIAAPLAPETGQSVIRQGYHERIREIRTLEDGEWKVIFSRVREVDGNPNLLSTHGQVSQDRDAGVLEDNLQYPEEDEAYKEEETGSEDEYDYAQPQSDEGVPKTSQDLPRNHDSAEVGPQSDEGAHKTSQDLPRKHDSAEVAGLQKTSTQQPKILTLEKSQLSRREMAIKTLSALQFRNASRLVAFSKRNTAHAPSQDFTVKPHLSFPLPQFTQSGVLRCEWVESLKTYLSSLKSKQISIVTASWEHKVVLLNWLISALVVAKPPLENVLVLSLSKALHHLLQSKNISSIFVDPKTIISDSATRLIRTTFSQVHIVRLTFFRLINHWGFNIVMYDSDAIILKNPQPLFDKYPGVELVGSAGKGPESISAVWGRTICTGVLLLRSSAAMEVYWEKMAKIARHPFTDQGLINIALKALHVSWKTGKQLKFTEDMLGKCQGSALKAVILTEYAICRYYCNEHQRNRYYVWHKPAIKRERTVEKKMERAQDGHAWFLRSNWENRNTYTGIDWLRDIAENVA